jgi:thymidine kinase
MELIEKRVFEDSEIIAIDEAQFFPDLYHFVVYCLGADKQVIIAGLDADAFQRKWGQVLDCIPLASEVTKLSALCMRCGNGKPGPFTKRIVEDTKLELIGGSDMYIAVCQKHL